MERLIDKELKQWKEKKDRKVLLLRGARQVGKTYSIRELSKTFKKFLEINFEETPAVCRFLVGWGQAGKPECRKAGMPHNHPSGGLIPTRADRDLTDKKKSLTWEKLSKYLKAHPLPRPKIYRSLPRYPPYYEGKQ